MFDLALWNVIEGLILKLPLDELRLFLNDLIEAIHRFILAFVKKVEESAVLISNKDDLLENG